MKIQCETCTHQQVCGFKEKYFRATERVEEIKPECTLINVEVKCREYAMAEPVMRNPLIQYQQYQGTGGASCGGR